MKNYFKILSAHGKATKTQIVLLKIIVTCLVTVISSYCSYPKGLWLLLVLSNVILTVALVTPAWPFLYTNSCKFVARTCEYMINMINMFIHFYIEIYNIT